MSRSLTMYDVFELLEDLVEQPGRIPGHMICPFHPEATASLAVWEDHWHCFGCSAGGSPLAFMAKRLGGWNKAYAFLEGGNVDFDTAPVERVEKELLDLGEVFEQATVNTTSEQCREAYDYVEEKWPHLGLNRLRRWGVGIGAYTLLIPHTDADGVIRGIKTRTFAGGNKGRKLAYPGSVFTTRLYRVVQKTGQQLVDVFLVEGESDTWTMSRVLQPHHTQVFGLPSGAQTWRPEFKAEVLEKNPHQVYVALDNDDTGNAAAEKIMKDIGPRAVRWAPPAPHKDWTDAYVAGWRP